MKLNLDNYLGSKPFLYGRKLLKDMGIKNHYVNERDVVDFLGYEIKTMTPVVEIGLRGIFTINFMTSLTLGMSRRWLS